MSCFYTAFGNYECSNTKNIVEKFSGQTENIVENFANQTKKGGLCNKSSECKGYNNPNGKDRLCCAHGTFPTCQDYDSNMTNRNCYI